MTTKRGYCEECDKRLTTKDVRKKGRMRNNKSILLLGECKGCGTTVTIAKATS